MIEEDVKVYMSESRMQLRPAHTHTRCITTPSKTQLLLWDFKIQLPRFKFYYFFIFSKIRHFISLPSVALFILRPTSVRMWHKAVFKVGPVAGPKPNATGSSKNASDPVGIPLFGAPQATGDKPKPSEEG